jgi:hypothetical protein
MIKTMLAIFLFALPSFAQDQAPVARAAAGCGPSETQFDVKTDKNNHPVAQPEAGKALVFVIEEERRDPDYTYIGAVTTRVGLDGAWVGANHGKSYFFFTVAPGEHNVCVNWQSALGKLAKLGAAVNLTAETGKVYFFRASVEERKERQPAVHLEPVDSAEGQFLISASAHSTSSAKK